MKQIIDAPIKILGGVVLVVEAILTLILTNTNPNDEQKLWITIGMIVSLILAIIGSVLIHWLNNRQVRSGATVDTDQKAFEYDIFISFPIAAITDAIKRKALNDFANELEEKFKTIGFKKIFNASLHFSNRHDHQPPKVAAKIDFDALDKSRNFLLIYPEKLPTSALIELGYAIAANKNIVMCSDNVHTLPFLARGFNEAFENICFVEYDTNQHLFDMLTQTHVNYFKQ